MSDLERMIEAIVDRRLEERLAELRPAEPELVTVAAFARSRSISQSTVRAAIRDGRLDAVRIGRAVRIPSDAQIGSLVKPATISARARRADLRLLGGGRMR